MSDHSPSSFALGNNHSSGLPFPAQPLPIQLKPEYSIPAQPAARPPGVPDEDSGDHKSSSTDSPRSRSSLSEDPFRGPLKRKPKDTECVHCHDYFTARGVLLHAQRCSKKRASEVAFMIENSTKAVQTHAQQEKELYENVIREMRQEMTRLQSNSQETVRSLELTRREHQFSIKYAEAMAVELHSARSEIARLEQILNFAFRGQQVSNEMDETIARLLSPQSS